MKYGKTIFLGTGHTFKFLNVTEVVENETSLSFSYIAMSDGLRKHVTFYLWVVAGHSTYELETK